MPSPWPLRVGSAPLLQHLVALKKHKLGTRFLPELMRIGIRHLPSMTTTKGM